jgi:putative heme-binding domain-containing protein
VHAALRRIFTENPDVTRQLRALWALHATNGLDATFLSEQSAHPSEHVRAWAVQLLCEDRNPSATALETFAQMAATERSPLVRLYLACALQRIEPAQRWPIATGLLARGEDAADHNLPLMIWYGIEPLVRTDLERFARSVQAAKIALVRRHIARRASEPDVRRSGLQAMVRQLAAAADDIRFDVLSGMVDGLKGIRSVPMPEDWTDVSESLRTSSHRGVAASALELALVFDDPAALLALQQQAADAAVPAETRTRAIEALVGRRPPDLAPLLLKLTADPVTRRLAVRGLAEYDHPDTPAVLLAAYPRFDDSARQDAIQTLASRREWAGRLLDAVESGVVARNHFTAYSARQLQQLGDPAVTARVTALWGEMRPTNAEKAAQIARWRRMLTPAVLADADPSAGRLVYQQLCSACHRLFDEGGSVGPDLTGSQRHNLEYLLENIIDPGAAVSRDFQLNTIRTASGRIVSGFVVAENESTVTVQSVNERVSVPVAEIKERQVSTQSMMPEGLLQNLTGTAARDLIGYLGSPAQVPAGAGKVRTRPPVRAPSGADLAPPRNSP